MKQPPSLLCSISSLVVLGGCGTDAVEEKGGLDTRASASLFEVVWSVGGALEAVHPVFGNIRDAVWIEEHGLFLLDDQEILVTWLDHDGLVVDSYNGTGSTHQFVFPVALEKSENGVLVLDRELGILQELSFAGDDLVPGATRNVPRGTQNVCRGSDSTLVLLPSELLAIRGYDAMGEEVVSWRLPFEDNEWQTDPGLATLWQKGELVCHEDSGTIIYVSENTGEVMRFAEDGALLWRITLPDFIGRPWQFSRGPDGVATVRSLARPEERFDKAVEAVILPGEVLGITVETDAAQSPPLATPIQPIERRLYTVRIADGRNLGSSPVLARVVGVQGTDTYGYISGGAPFGLKWHRSERRGGR